MENIIHIDYPEENEEISIGTGYTIRIYASECEYVEVSINGGDWNQCRNTCGYWWYDWDEIEEGRYEIRARMFKSNGEMIMSSCRTCTIC